MEACRADLLEPCGHDTCRVHAECAELFPPGSLVWHPERCHFCYAQVDVLQDEKVSFSSLWGHSFVSV